MRSILNDGVAVAARAFVLSWYCYLLVSVWFLGGFLWVLCWFSVSVWWKCCFLFCIVWIFGLKKDDLDSVLCRKYFVCMVFVPKNRFLMVYFNSKRIGCVNKCNCFFNLYRNIEWDWRQPINVHCIFKCHFLLNRYVNFQNVIVHQIDSYYF